MRGFHTAENDRKRNRKLQRAGYLAGIALFATVLSGPFFTQMAYAEKETKTESNSEVYYKGKVTARVNVRVGAGEKNEKLLYNKKGVQLEPGEEVLILDEVLVEDKPWYHIRFQRGKDILEGYSTSSYITKGVEAITPSPEPTPTPTPTPAPTPSPAVTAEPTAAVPADVDKETGETGGSKTGLIVGVTVCGVLLVLGAGGVIYYRRNHKKQESSELVDAVQRLEEKQLGNLEAVSADKKKNSGMKLPEIRPAKKEGKPREKNSLRDPGVYVKKPAEPIFQKTEEELTPEERILAVTKENEEKKVLRKELDELREHDLVEHKFFGKGEVFDNTDVKLIEIRFGNDVRFLNKDSLAAKKILRKCAESERRWRY